jgi:Spy/CpxP family protein refolding chaperone
VKLTLTMNKLICLTTLTAGLALGQGPGGFPGFPGFPGGNPPTAQQAQERRLQFLTDYLGLTTTQRAQAEAIFNNQRSAVAPLVQQLQPLRDILAAGAKAQRTNAEIDETAAQLGAVTGQITAIQVKAEADFYRILTPEQQQKLDRLHEEGPRRIPGFGSPR